MRPGHFEPTGTGPSTLDSKLASVCVVNAEGNQVYFSYAAPSRRVTDYRTRYSGIRPHMLEGAPRVEEVQRQVRELVRGRVLVGHGLDNDLKVLGFHHPRHLVRDTARMAWRRSIVAVQNESMRASPCARCGLNR